MQPKDIQALRLLSNNLRDQFISLLSILFLFIFLTQNQTTLPGRTEAFHESLQMLFVLEEVAQVMN